MTLKDYTTEQLKHICSYKMTDFKKELEKRESIEKAKSFNVFVDDCFYDEEQKCLYEITEVTDSTIHYNNIYLNISQIEQWDSFCDVGEIDFSKFTKIRKNIVDIINTKLETFNRLVGEMHDKVIDKADGCPGVVCAMKWDEDVSDMKYCVTFANGVDFGWFANDSINYFKIKKDENLEETQSNQDIDKVVDNLEKTTVKNHKMGPKSKLPSKYYEDKLDETKSKREYDELRMPLDDDDKLATEATIMGKKILPPDGYLVGKITQTDNGMLVEYVEKKPKYPTTYEECYDEGNTELHFIYVDKDERDLYESFIQLIRCRNAYWKIAGEVMGLDEPWKHNYLKDANTIRYAIYNTGDEIVKLDGKLYRNYILCFPTEEMRDAFYENFKKEIEQCKELL